MNNKMIELKTRDGICETYISFPEGQENLPIVLFYMDAIGLRPRIYEMVDQLASEGYFVIAPNLFYRTNKVPMVDYETLLRPENREELMNQVMAIAKQITTEMAKSDAEYFLNYARSQPQANPHKVGSVGYCMGGGHALRAAGNYPEAFLATASFHAGGLATDLETSPHRLFKNIKSEVYIGHADQDRSMPPEQIERVHTELEAAQLNYKAELYVGCLHGWTMSDVPAYNHEGEKKHWKELLSLFGRTLQ